MSELLDGLVNYDHLLKVHLLEEEELIYPMLLSMSAQEHDDFLRLTSKESIINAREARKRELESAST